MSNELETQREHSVMELVGGIVNDVHKLVEQQLGLFRHEVRSEIGHAQGAVTFAAVGLAILLAGGILLAQMLVQFLASAIPGLPLWGSYGIVGAPVAALGLSLSLAGIQKYNVSKPAAAERAHNARESVDG